MKYTSYLDQGKHESVFFKQQWLILTEIRGLWNLTEYFKDEKLSLSTHFKEEEHSPDIQNAKATPIKLLLSLQENLYILLNLPPL